MIVEANIRTANKNELLSVELKVEINSWWLNMKFLKSSNDSHPINHPLCTERYFLLALNLTQKSNIYPRNQHCINHAN
jgi:hypothetical protein